MFIFFTYYFLSLFQNLLCKTMYNTVVNAYTYGSSITFLKELNNNTKISPGRHFINFLFYTDMKDAWNY